MARKKTKGEEDRPREYAPVSAAPVKSFFVDMLTRDISLGDAILDLLDNCVDGIIRKKHGQVDGTKPYDGFYAHIKYGEHEFELSDNCGGIPWEMHDYAFRMGRAQRPAEPGMPTVGVYGIGMKRAIFKIGRHTLIQTQHKNDAYDVEIAPQWLEEQDNWDIPVTPSTSPMREDGTTIVVSELNDGVRSLFGDDEALFDKEFTSKVGTHYAFIINKGFNVTVNGKRVQPRPTELRFEKKSGKAVIRPFIYQTKVGGVEVFLAVGLTHPIPSEEDIQTAQERKQHSSLDAGWTVVCNDRAVVYCDRTELTGWGEAGVPQYHNQFIAISGIVEFRSDDASKLPTTTTKRGIDASSRLYLQVKNKMREGLRMFTDFTNKWKGRELAQQAQHRIRNADPTPLEELKHLSSELKLTDVLIGARGKQYKPRLPMPTSTRGDVRRISFERRAGDIRDVADFLFENARKNPSEIGGACFDRVLDEAHA